MATFANNKKPYNEWDDAKKECLIGKLLDIIDDYPRLYVSFGIRVDDYFEIIKARNHLEIDIVRAYHICARKCMELVSDMARTAGHAHKILHVFHHGNAAWPSFAETLTQPMLDSLKILVPIAQSHLDVVSLQAADIVAHQIARDTMVSLGYRKPSTKSYMERLLGKPGFRHMIDINELKELYREELMLDEHRSRNSYPKRETNLREQTEHVRVLAGHLFVEPELYEVNKRLRELRTTT